MFVIFAVLISVAILILFYQMSQQRASAQRAKFELLTNLRQLVHYLRRHRALSHRTISGSDDYHDELPLLEEAMEKLCAHIVDTAHFDNKPVYRILQRRIVKLTEEWQELELNRNQMSHGKAIRHCLFLMDELTLGWLLETQRADLSEGYNLSWQQVNDALEALTQFRLSISDIDTASGAQRFKNSAASLLRRTNQLAVVSQKTYLSAELHSISQHLEALTEQGRACHYSESELYKLSSRVSLLIFTSYDDVLGNVTGSIYKPLPELKLSVST